MNILYSRICVYRYFARRYLENVCVFLIKLHLRTLDECLNAKPILIYLRFNFALTKNPLDNIRATIEEDGKNKIYTDIKSPPLDKKTYIFRLNTIKRKHF